MAFDVCFDIIVTFAEAAVSMLWLHKNLAELNKREAEKICGKALYTRKTGKFAQWRTTIIQIVWAGLAYTWLYLTTSSNFDYSGIRAERLYRVLLQQRLLKEKFPALFVLNPFIKIDFILDFIRECIWATRCLVQ